MQRKQGEVINKIQGIVTLPDQAALRWVGKLNLTIPERVRYVCRRDGGRGASRRVYSHAQVPRPPPLPPIYATNPSVIGGGKKSSVPHTVVVKALYLRC